jgi:hypothetical protein
MVRWSTLRLLVRIALTLIGLGAMGACGRASLDDVGTNIRVPAEHRASSVCPLAPAAGDPICQRGSNPVVLGFCNSDGDCDPGRKGRCEIVPPSGGCACVYDACHSDADCSVGAACACNPVEFGNACVTGECRVDQDCGDGGFCGPVIYGCSTKIVEYQCYGSDDTCVDDGDCEGRGTCFATDGQAWACHPTPFCRG